MVHSELDRDFHQQNCLPIVALKVVVVVVAKPEALVVVAGLEGPNHHPHLQRDLLAPNE
jgi:hypothetical protein